MGVLDSLNFNGVPYDIRDNSKQPLLTFDDVPTADSANPVKSGGVHSSIAGVASDLSSHKSNTANPHAVTKAQVGLGNVDNTADADKPVSTAAQTALNGKVDKVAGKGLSKNDYTDADKAIVGGVTSALAGKVDVVEGKGLSENDYTDADKEIVDGVTAALNEKVDKVTGMGLSQNSYTDAEKTKLTGIESGAEANVQSDWNETDSTDDSFIKNKPTALKNPYSVIFTGAVSSSYDGSSEVTVNIPNSAEWGNITGDITDQTDLAAELAAKLGTQYTAAEDGFVAKVDSTDHVLKVMAGGSSAVGFGDLTGVPSDNDALDSALDAKQDVIDSTHKLSADLISETSTNKFNVQADWSGGGLSAILNKPTNVSDFVNDENYQDDTQVAASITSHNGSNSSHEDIRQSVSDEVSRAEREEAALQTQIDALEARSDVVDVVATKAALNAYSGALSKNDIVKVLKDESQSNAISYYRVNGNTPVAPYTWTLVGNLGEYYTKSEANDYFVPQQRTINGKALSGNVTLTASDVGALPDNTTLADLSDDSTHRLVTDTQITSWNGKQNALTFDDVPTSGSNNPVKSDGVYDAVTNVATLLFGHERDTSNPHEVSKSQVGLGNVDNTSDANKPISTATQNALDLKADDSDLSAHIADVSNPHSVTKAQVGLGNVDNTADADKPVSTAAQAALNLKANDADLSAHTGNTNNPHSVTAAQVGLGNVTDGAQINVIEEIKKNGTALSILNKAVNITLSASDVGLGNVDNTADADKPISTAVQTALNGKASSEVNAKVTFLIDVSVSSWVSDSTYSEYGYAATIQNTGITANTYAEVILSHANAISGDYSPVVLTTAGTLKIYSKKNSSITIPSIVLIDRIV